MELKTLRIMKLTAIIVLIACLQVNAKGRAQNVTLSLKDAPLEKVFSAIEKQTGFYFTYTRELLQGTKKVNLNVTNASLQEVLSLCLKDQPVTYEIIDRAILIKVDESKTNISNEMLLPPPGDLKGRVTDENGDPLVGASIKVSGTNWGATTDDNGYYKIDNVPDGEYTLEVSYVGFVSKTSHVKLTNGNVLTSNYTMTASLVNLDAVTVGGTLSERKVRAYPATLTVIEQKDLKNRNLNNLADVLEAIPGIVVSPGSEIYNSGNSRNPHIMIRGTSGIIKYIVDGVEIVPSGDQGGFLQTLDPNNIEKLEILKGPMASTLYGSGAGGGVIVITTKKGKSGKAKLNLKTMFTQYANDYANYNAYNQNYSLNVSGGGEQFNYLLGAGYNFYPLTKLSDINNGIDDKTWSYTAKFGGRYKTISADLSLQYGTKNYGSSSTAISDNKYRESLGLSAYSILPLDDAKTSQRGFTNSLHIKQALAKNWYHDLTVGYDIQNIGSAFYTRSFLGTFYNNEFLSSKINTRYFMFYDHSWSKNIQSNITAGFEYTGYETHSMLLQSTDSLINFFAISSAAGEGSASYTKAPYSSQGYFAEAVTSLNDKLFLTTGIRFDVNSAYGDNVGSYPQPRVGLSYVINTGDFNIKPRIVWGVSSDAPDPTFKLSYVQVSAYGINVQHGNPDIKPTRSEGYEFGADIFFQNNYSLKVTCYDQKLKDRISFLYTSDYSTNPPTTTIYFYNIARSINRGLEISANALIAPFSIYLSYTQSVNKWGKEIGQDPTPTVYPGAPLSGIPKKSAFARITYALPSFLSWTKKGGSIIGEWKYTGSSNSFDDISYYTDIDAWQNNPTLPYPDFYSYYRWVKGYSYFNLRADYSIANYAALYIDVQNLLDKQGSPNGQTYRFPGRRINFGLNLTL